jgi:hypothetical protein
MGDCSVALSFCRCGTFLGAHHNPFRMALPGPLLLQAADRRTLSSKGRLKGKSHHTTNPSTPLHTGSSCQSARQQCLAAFDVFVNLVHLDQSTAGGPRDDRFGATQGAVPDPARCDSGTHVASHRARVAYLAACISNTYGDILILECGLCPPIV